MKKIILFFLLFSLLLAGCGAPAEPVATETQAPALPEPVDIGGTLVETDAETLNLDGIAYDLSILVIAAHKLEAVSQIELGVTSLTHGQIRQIQTAFPNARLHYCVEILGQTYGMDTTELDLSAMTPDQAADILARLPLLPELRSINFVSEDGACAFTLDDVPVLDQFRQILPDAKFNVSFELFGQQVTSEDERIEYFRVPIGNEGVEIIRSVLPYLSSCQYLLLDTCDIDNEVMAQLREDFPQPKVVWRVWLGEPYFESPNYFKRSSFLTDTHVIWTRSITDTNCHVLKYCTETKYVDFGHDGQITICDFLAYMPDLEVAILAITPMNDLTPLANCPKLEYLEIFEARFTDLTPLANCTELKHLNISTLPGLTDITPLYGLTKLERLRVINCPGIPREQLAEFAQLVPDCAILTRGWDETGDGWRYDDYGNKVPRYALLQEQLEYYKP